MTETAYHLPFVFPFFFGAAVSDFRVSFSRIAAGSVNTDGDVALFAAGVPIQPPMISQTQSHTPGGDTTVENPLLTVKIGRVQNEKSSS